MARPPARPTGLTPPTLANPQGAVPRTLPRNPDGILVIVAAVTGVVDQVEDLIQPGAFLRTFRQRRPKVVVHHSWPAFAGRSLIFEEIMPGDSRLPKTQNDGTPWPPDAGAVMAAIQFNMNTQAGRDAYEWAMFYTENNECEWSIGYKVVPGRTAKRRDGARIIYDLDVYEFSLVLFGAAKETMTVEGKSLDEDVMAHKTAAADLDPSSALFAVMQAKALKAAQTGGPSHAGLAVIAKDTGRTLMMQRSNRDPHDRAAGTWEFPGGGIDAGETPQAGAEREWQEETGMTLPATGVHTDTWDSPNGVYRGHVMTVPHETDLALNPDKNKRTVTNPDDPHSVDPEVTTWWDLQHAKDNPALRPECADTPWPTLAEHAGVTLKKDTPMEKKDAQDTQPAANPSDLAFLRRLIIWGARQTVDADRAARDGNDPQTAVLARRVAVFCDAMIVDANGLLKDAGQATVDPNEQTPLFDQYNGNRPAAYAVMESKALAQSGASAKLTVKHRKSRAKKCQFCGKKDATVVRAWHGGSYRACPLCDAHAQTPTPTPDLEDAPVSQGGDGGADESSETA